MFGSEGKVMYQGQNGNGAHQIYDRGDVERLELIMVTTGGLSHQKQIRLPDQWGPQRKQAI